MKKTLLKTLLLTCLLSIWGANAYAATLEDVITHDVIGVSGTTYTDVTFYGPTSGVTYEGTTAGGNSAIQLRTSGSKEGFVSTVSCGKVTKIAIKWNSNTSSGRKLDVYGSNTAYSASTDLYDSSKQGTLLVEFAYADGDGEFTVTGDYEYIGIRSNDSALYLDEIDITWDGTAIDNPGDDGDGGDEGYHDGDFSASGSTVTLTNPNISVGTETASIDFTTMGLENATDVDGREFTFDDNSTVVFSKGSGTTTPKYYTSGTAIRLYADNTATFTCNKVIAKIEIHTNGTDGNTSTETVEFSDDGKSAIYCNLYTSTSGGTYLYVQSITIYYEGEGGDEPDTGGEGHGYSADDPFTASEALALAETLDSSTTLSGVYVKGIISQITEISTSYGNATYYISDDGTTNNQLEIFRGYYLDGERFTSEDEIKVTDTVIVNGDLVDYQGNTPEITTGSKIVYLEEGEGTGEEEPGPEEEHTFNFAENTYGMTVYSGSDSDYETEVKEITSDDGVVINFDSGHYRMWNSSGEGNHLRIGGATSSNYDAYCTISGPAGSNVLEVVITGTGNSSENMSASNPTVNPEGGSYENHVYTWTGEAESVTFHFTSVTHVYYIDVTTDAEASTGTITISSAGYATYYTDVEYTMPEGVTGTTVTGVEDEVQEDSGYVLDMDWSYTAGSTVPAGTALVLKGSEGEYTYTITSTNAAAPTDNLLMGSTTSVETYGPEEGTSYVFYELTNGQYGIGFYWGTDNGGAFQSGANKAWLALTTEQSRNARFLGFGDGEDTTGISSVESASEGATVKGIYTIQGVRVSNMNQPGLYIVDGRKVLVK